MKKHRIVFVAGLLVASTHFCIGQDLSPRQIPSLVLNSFKQGFPKAYDIEWEMNGNQYNVEFETGMFTDHEIWYDTTGKIIRHEEDISRDQLPTQVIAKLDKDFKGFQTDDIQRITTQSGIEYSLELDSNTQEWKIILNQKGEIITQITD
ncbi:MULTISPECIES: PepSY-like domain-containing protein [Reichenbachiella]|uniref:PepSY-like domain-containing protein n=1 Tax=Reichenbachiella TaxID=156993 RepID=UPI000E6BFE73|nr:MULTISPECIES: PepSY-like domain-containing protein [Reichenbachiella]MBU2913488.1 PepSY-like domain-containing protein [Reichenbachiella agariperforans]RJE74542.1 hypothetical protein BGP76_15465 [Reichenbachiella sp. MSK19-1]